MGQMTARLTDFFRQTLSDHLVTIHIEQFVFDGRTPCVDNQNLHKTPVATMLFPLALEWL
jgi:hypothetical protein